MLRIFEESVPQNLTVVKLLPGLECMCVLGEEGGGGGGT